MSAAIAMAPSSRASGRAEAVVDAASQRQVAAPAAVARHRAADVEAIGGVERGGIAVGGGR